MFSADHFIWIGISLFFVGILLFLTFKFKFSQKTATYIILGIYIVTEVFKISTHMYPASRWLGEGAKVDGSADAMYLLPKSLPFQICSSMIFPIIYLAFGKNEKVKETLKSFVVPVFLIAAPLAILLGTCLNADNTAHLFDSFKDPDCGPYQFFLYHAGMVWYGIYLLSTKTVKMGFHVWINNFIFLFCMIMVSIWINSFLIVYGTNFMFTVAPPAKGIPLINMKHGWVVYMIHYLFVVALFTFLFQLPAIIKQWKAKKVSE